MAEESSKLVTTGDGDVVRLPSSSAEMLKESAQAHTPTAAELRKAATSVAEGQALSEAREKREGTLGKYLFSNAAGAGLNAISGATLGLSDKALEAAGATGAVDLLKDFNKTSPWLEGSSRLGGAIAGMALGAGEVSAGLKGTAAAAKIAAMEGSTLGRAALTGGRIGAEMAAMDIGDQLHESVLGDEELVAQKVVASAGKAFMLGSVLGVGGSLAASGWKARGALRGSATLDEILSKGESSAAKASELGAEVDGAAARGIGDSFVDQRFNKAIGATPSNVRSIGRRYAPGEFPEIVLKKMEQDKISPLSDVKKIHEWASEQKSAVGERLSSILGRVDEVGAPKPSYQNLAELVDEKIVKPNILRFEDRTRIVGGKTVTEKVPIFKPGALDDLSEVKSWMGKLEALGEDSSNKQWQEARIRLDKATKWDATKPQPVQDNLKKLRDIVENDSLVGNIEKSVSKDLADEYVSTKKLYQAMRDLGEITERSAAKSAAGSGPSFLTKLGAGAALLSGHPLEAAGIVGSSLAADRLNLAAAQAARKVSSIFGLRQMATRADAAIAGGAKNIVGDAVPRTAAADGIFERIPRLGSPEVISSGATAAERRRKYNRIADAVRSADAASIANRVGEQFGDLATSAPKTSAAIAATAARGVAFLREKLPPTVSDPYTPTPQFSEPNRMVSDIDISNFMHYAEAVSDPIGVMNLVAKGKGNRRHVDALQAVYPKLYKAMIMRVTHNLIHARKPLSFQALNNVHILTGVPTSRAMSSQSQKALGATFAVSSGQKPSIPSGASISISKNYQTSLDRIARK